MKKIFLSFAFLGTFFLFSNDANAQSAQKAQTQQSVKPTAQDQLNAFNNRLAQVKNMDMSKAQIQAMFEKFIQQANLPASQKTQMRSQVAAKLKELN